MGIFKDKGPKLSGYVVATVFGRQLTCGICGGGVFSTASYKLATTVTASLGPSMFAENSFTLICSQCGHLIQFAEQNAVATDRIPYREGTSELDLPVPPQPDSAAE